MLDAECSGCGAPISPVSEQERARVDDEFYATDREVVVELFAVLDRLAEYDDALARVIAAGARAVDPAMGGLVKEGVVRFDAPYYEVMRERGMVVSGFDCRESSLAGRESHPNTAVCDYLDAPVAVLGGYLLALTNPPFKIFRDFVRRALQHCDVVGLLLPIGSREIHRRPDALAEDVAFWSKYPPRIIVETKRIRFSGDSSSANQTYGTFFWFRDDVGHGDPNVSGARTVYPRLVCSDVVLGGKSS